MGCITSPLRDAVGHGLPGIIFIIIAIKWTNSVFRRYFLCLREAQIDPENARKFKSSLCYPIYCAPRIPLEAILGLSCSIGGFLGEHNFHLAIEDPTIKINQSYTVQYS